LKVLLTGASGFVGSHILDLLLDQGVATAILLRNPSRRALLGKHLPEAEIRTGSITVPGSLVPALDGITHVIHCAGCTKASRPAEYREINQTGTANVVNAVNARSSAVQQLVHISSLAVSGPALPDQPSREDTIPNPVSEYGRSKLGGELEVLNRCQVPFTILRPPAVYGPRDTSFLPMFKAVSWHVLPRPSNRQALSLVFVRDLAAAVLMCLGDSKADGKIYFVASREVVTSRRLAELIAQAMNVWTVSMPLPAVLLWPICLLQELISRTTGRASLLNLQKYAELRAPGWVCDPSRLETELGYACRTTLALGVPQTIQWYRQEHWL